MAKLKPLRDDKELAAIPLGEPVLVVLDPAPTGAEAEGSPQQQERQPARKEQPDADEGEKVLKQQLEAAQKAREAAERQTAEERTARAKVERDLVAARAQSATNESDAIASGLAAAQAERDAAKAAVKQAFEAGDADKLAEAQERLGRSAADIREYERAQVLSTQARERERNQPRQEQQRPADINQVIDQMQLLPQERDWLKSHPEALMDKSRNTELDAAYIKATRKGLARGTDAYFQFIEKEMGYEQPEQPDGEDEGTTIVAAPVSRETRSSVSGQPQGNKITLSPEQREFARTMGLSDVQYARQVAALQQDKKTFPEKYAGRA